jgi:hypothetical protein
MKNDEIGRVYVVILKSKEKKHAILLGTLLGLDKN